MKKVLAFALLLAMALSLAACGSAGAEASQPAADAPAQPAEAAEAPRAFEDGFIEIAGQTEEVYLSNTDWTAYYSDVSWEDYAFNMMLLLNKGYEIEGGLPDWLFSYRDNMSLLDPGIQGDSYSLVANLPGWQKLEVGYYPDGAQSPGGMTYTASVKVLELGEKFLAGDPPPEWTEEAFYDYDYEEYLDVKTRRAGDEADMPRKFSDSFWHYDETEEHYISNTDWTVYFKNASWEDYLLYLMVLHKKGYTIELPEGGGMPDYVQDYIDTMNVDLPFAQTPETVEMIADKPTWQRVKVEYFFEEQQSPDGMPYTMRLSVLELYEDYLAGVSGIGLEYEDYAAYGEKRDERRAEREAAAAEAGSGVVSEAA